MGVAKLVGGEHMGVIVAARRASVIGILFGVILGEFEWYSVAFFGYAVVTCEIKLYQNYFSLRRCLD